jgi:hypothetical protein
VLPDGERPTWGVEITAGLSALSAGTERDIEKIAAGITGPSRSLLNKTLEIRRNAEQSVSSKLADSGMDASFIDNAGLEKQIRDSLSSVWTTPQEKKSNRSIIHNAPESVTGVDKPDLESTDAIGKNTAIEVAILFGQAKGNAILRVELRLIASRSVNIDLSGAGVSVEFEKKKRLAAVGYDQGEWKGEVLGKRKGGDK